MQSSAWPAAFRDRASSARADAANAHGDDDVEFLVSAESRATAAAAREGRLGWRAVAYQSRAAGRDAARRTRCPVWCSTRSTPASAAVSPQVGRSAARASRRRSASALRHASAAGRGQATHQVRVTKLTRWAGPRNALDRLDGADERVEEIARMLGGVEVTDRRASMLAKCWNGPRESAAVAASARPTCRQRACLVAGRAIRAHAVAVQNQRVVGDLEPELRRDLLPGALRCRRP